MQIIEQPEKAPATIEADFAASHPAKPVSVGGASAMPAE
jgi:hypothetical protein